MLKSTTCLYLICLFLFMASCDSKKNTANESASEENMEETATEETNTVETEAEVFEEMSETDTNEDGAKKVVLSGVYVTSTKMPHSRYSFKYLFDNNKDTHWETMQGAGPDEGIMLYFDKETEITQLGITQLTGPKYAEIKRIELFVNGRPQGTFSVKDDMIAIGNQTAKSMYIKFDYVSDLKMVDSFDKIYEANQLFDHSKSLGISEIVLKENSTPLKLVAPSVLKGTLKASSTLDPQTAYGIHNLMDSHKEFAWVEGAKGMGEGEVINAKLEKPTSITGLLLYNGFQRSQKHFDANARAKELEIADENGRKNIIELRNTMGEQDIKLKNPLSGKNINIKINKVYAGTAYEDLVISELKFKNNDQLMVVADNQLETAKKELLQKAKGTPLENKLDKRILYVQGEMEGFSTSFILRSDYTFVSYYEERENDNIVNETVADGNWEIKELEPEKAVIRVFGKLNNVSTTIDYYAGNSIDSFTQIFQDFVSITDNSIAGEKFIREHKIITE